LNANLGDFGIATDLNGLEHDLVKFTKTNDWSDAYDIVETCDASISSQTTARLTGLPASGNDHKRAPGYRKRIFR
jgi:hypothetical protein